MRNLKLKGLKYNKGRFDLFNERFVFFPPQLIDILSSIYGEGVKSLLVWLGKKTGWKLVQNWEENFEPKTLDELTEKFCSIMSNQGWGNFTSDQISEDKIIITLKHNISSDMDNRSRYVCYFLSGVMTGFGEFALYRVNVREEECAIEDPTKESCMFVIGKKQI
jgi:predicted ArsR family transcriptional regulator